MTKNIRRFAATISLTLMLTASGAIAAPTSDRDIDRDRTSIVRAVKQFVKRVFRVGVSSTPVGPIPAPTAPNPS